MTELQSLLFGNPHPLPAPKPSVEDVGNYGKRSKNYGKATEIVLEEAKKHSRFTIADLSAKSGVDRGTINRALLKLAAAGKVRKEVKQTAGNGRNAAVWAVVISPS